MLCIAYVIPGYVGREPWKNADIASFGYMLALLDAGSWREWLQPSMMGLVPDNGALLPYWLGAWAMQALMPLGLAPEIAARVPYLLMLAGTLVATWYAVYHLARDPSAQPVAFAFGGEAEPVDYARALADGSLLALVATLGLAQFSHETTPALAQLFFGTGVRRAGGAADPAVGPVHRAPRRLAGADAVGRAPRHGDDLRRLGGCWLALPGAAPAHGAARLRALLQLLALVGLCLVLALALDLFRWRIAPWRTSGAEWSSLGRLLCGSPGRPGPSCCGPCGAGAASCCRCASSATWACCWPSPACRCWARCSRYGDRALLLALPALAVRRHWRCPRSAAACRR